MNTINLDLMKNINLTESKSTYIENKKVDNSNSFENYLNKSKDKLKEDNRKSNNLDNKIENKSQDVSNDDLSKVIDKIEDVLQNNNDDLEEIDLSENISEIIILLLKNFSENENRNSNEVGSFSLENIDNNINFTDLKGISNFIKENLILKNNSIDKSKVISQLNDIKTSIDEILNSMNLSGLKNEISLDDTLVNQINELLKEVVKKDIIGKEDLKLNENINIKENENLNIEDIVNYLKNNFVKEDEEVDYSIDIKQFKDLNNLTNVNSSENYKEDTFNNLDNKNNNSNINFESTDKSLETLKEKDILSKILNEDTGDAKFNNYYDRMFNNKLQSNIEVITEPVNINKETMNTDIIKNIKYMIMDSIEELSVKIYPKELGEVTIKILSEEGIMKAEIKATSKETYNLLNANINDVKKNLESQNIKIQEVNIGIYNEDTTFFSGKEKGNENSRSFNEDIKKSYIYEDDDVIEEVSFNNNVNYLA